MPQQPLQQTVEGLVVAGHGVASGRSGDPRFPEGTLALQWPTFAAAGIDLKGIHRGTINVSVAPLLPQPLRPRVTLPDVRWHPDCAAETFSFFDMRVAIGAPEEFHRGYIYRPHPETKPEHFQDPHVLELLAPQLDGVSLGERVWIRTDPRQMAFAH